MNFYRHNLYTCHICHAQSHIHYRILRAGLTIRGLHTNVRRGPFSHTRSQDFLWRALFTFLPTKSWRPFLVIVVVTFKPTLNVQTFKRQNSVVKIWQLIAPPLLAAGPSFHGTTGTVANPRPWVYCVNQLHYCGWPEVKSKDTSKKKLGLWPNDSMYFYI